ncbi:MAG: OstA family protein [Sphingomonas sp. SCN 67-18]|uniref:LptA/OstA family protein n=1 Tax=uncultured Sphingomonas sp. TaxID=158754 RepID=UPI00086F473E|nr:LptA/OstA family protein [Sphingomonas sp. SCN 67-18]ODU21990.1 MAG: OstA family protein [Sphingomonas sp. SCN 67-18]
MKSRSLLSAAAIGLVLAVAAAPAIGQALRNHDSNAPVDVEADRIEVQDRADRAVFSGNVKVRQAGLALDAARLTVAYAGGAASQGIQIQRLDASGGVTVRSASETARGEFAIYDLNRRQITMLGGVVLDQGASQVRGGRMVIDLDSGRAVVDGSSVGGAGVGTGTGGRVTGRFTVPQRAK